MSVNMIRGAIIAAAVAGCMIQMYQVSDQYFRYQTRTQVDIRIPGQAMFHNLAVCIAFNDLLDASRLNKDTGIHLKQPQTFMQTLTQGVPITIKQVFDYTPRVDEIIDWCIVRKDDWLFDTKRWKGCHVYFNVTKYLTQENVCYNIKTKDHPVIELRHVTQSQYYAFGIYTVELTEVLQNARLLNTISFTGDYPSISRDFSSFSLLAGDNGIGNKTINVFDVFSSDVEVQQLPAPFDTRCISRSSDDQFTCKYDCLKERFSTLKKIHPNVIIPHPIDYKIISISDMEDREIAALVRKHDHECHKVCFFNPCLMKYTTTSISSAYDPVITLSFTMRSPTQPDILSISEPVMMFVEYFSFLCSCIGTWFGYCFLSLDSFRYKVRKKYNKLMRRVTRALHEQIRTSFYPENHHNIKRY